jgi:hypothetical protein
MGTGAAGQDGARQLDLGLATEMGDVLGDQAEQR